MRVVLSILMLMAWTLDAAPVIGRRIAAPVAVAAGGTTLLLDESGLGSAAAAYSVRKLRSAYSGSALRVRRSSDSTEQDIGFSGNDLDTASLESFCAATDGFMVTWYDQSGNGRNLTQSTASSQPQIVSSGTVITGSNSKPALYFNSDYIVNAGSKFTGLTAATAFAVVRKVTDSDGGRLWKWGSSASANHYAFFDGIIYDEFGTTVRKTTGNPSQDLTVWHLYQVLSKSGTWTDWHNTTQHYTVGSNTVGFQATVDLGGTGNLIGYYHEMVVWGSDVTSSQSTARSNVNAYFSLY